MRLVLSPDVNGGGKMPGAELKRAKDAQQPEQRMRQRTKFVLYVGDCVLAPMGRVDKKEMAGKLLERGRELGLWNSQWKFKKVMLETDIIGHEEKLRAFLNSRKGVKILLAETIEQATSLIEMIKPEGVKGINGSLIVLVDAGVQMDADYNILAARITGKLGNVPIIPIGTGLI